MDVASRNAADSRDFVMTRIIHAPQALVWKAWTEPQHMAAWWGPRGMTNPVCEMDVRPGGRWHLVMQTPDGTRYPLSGVYHEVVAPERLVFTDNWAAHPAEWQEMLRQALGKEPASQEALNTVTFEDLGDRTRLVIRMQFESPELRDAMVDMGMEQGWTEMLDRLDEGTATAEYTGRTIVQSRVLDAPRELVFDAWTDPRQVTQWWGPNGFTTTTRSMDVRPGGKWLHVMHGPDGTDYDNEITYIEVARPQRLVYTHAAPLFHVTVTFDDDHGRTRLSMRAVFDSAAERQMVAKTGAIEGGKQHLERLAAFLANMEKN